MVLVNPRQVQIGRWPPAFPVSLVRPGNGRIHDLWQCFVSDLVQVILVPFAGPYRERISAPPIDNHVSVQLVKSALLMLLCARVQIARVDRGNWGCAPLVLSQAFRPEFLNRLDGILIFNRLDKKDIRNIVDIQMKRYEKLLAQQDIKIELTEKAKDKLADLGYDPAFGARPLKRVIQKEVLDPLALKIVAGEIKEGDKVKVDFKEGKIIFEIPRKVSKRKREKVKV